jgi:hypothetical protein
MNTSSGPGNIIHPTFDQPFFVGFSPEMRRRFPYARSGYLPSLESKQSVVPLKNTSISSLQEEVLNLKKQVAYLQKKEQERPPRRVRGQY